MFPNSKLLTHFPAAETEQRGGGEERLDLDPEDTWHVDTWTPAVTVSPGVRNVFKPAEIGQNWFYKTIVLLSQNVTKQRWFFSQTGVIMSMSPKQVELQYSLNIITIKNCQYTQITNLASCLSKWATLRVSILHHRDGDKLEFESIFIFGIRTKLETECGPPAADGAIFQISFRKQTQQLENSTNYWFLRALLAGTGVTDGLRAEY